MLIFESKGLGLLTRLILSFIRQLADMGRKIDEVNVHNALLADLRYVFKQLLN